MRLQAREGWAASQGQNCVVVLATELTPELLREGYARDLVRLIQERRKELDCEFTDRIAVAVSTESGVIAETIAEHGDTIAVETLADNLSLGVMEVEPVVRNVAGAEVQLFVSVSGGTE